MCFFRMRWLRTDGGPVFYSYSNRTPVTGDVQMITTCLVFGTIFTAFLIIFPGVRKEVSSLFIQVSYKLRYRQKDGLCFLNRSFRQYFINFFNNNRLFKMIQPIIRCQTVLELFLEILNPYFLSSIDFLAVQMTDTIY